MTLELMKTEKTMDDMTNVNVTKRPSWLWMPCRFQLFDRLLMIACLLMTASTSVSLALAQGTDKPVVEAPPVVAPIEPVSPEAAPATKPAAAPSEDNGQSKNGEDSSEPQGDAIPLTVPPLSTDSSRHDSPVRSEGRPDWVDTVLVARRGITTIVVSSDPKVMQEAAVRSLDVNIREKVDQYVDDLLAVPNAHQFLSWDVNELRSRLIREGDTYEDVVKYEVGMMHEAHAMLTVDAAFRNDIQLRWQRVVTSIRLVQTGAIALSVLAVLFVVFSYLRLDTASRGYYTGRLRMLGGMAMLGVIVFGIMFLRYNLDWVRLMLYS
jgi:type IV secretory pathway VirB2 component (pilin)